MFGFIDDVIDLASDTVSSVTKTATDFIEKPIDTTIKVATQPLKDGLNIIDGLTEGEIRTKAIARLGVDVVAGMATSELIDWYKSN